MIFFIFYIFYKYDNKLLSTIWVWILWYDYWAYILIVKYKNILIKSCKIFYKYDCGFCKILNFYWHYKKKIYY